MEWELELERRLGWLRRSRDEEGRAGDHVGDRNRGGGRRVDVVGIEDVVGVNAKGWILGNAVYGRVAGRRRAYQQVGSEQGVTIAIGIGITARRGRGMLDVGGQGGCRMVDGTVQSRWKRESEHVHRAERTRSRCTAPRRGQWAVVGWEGTCRTGQGAKDVLRAKMCTTE